MNGTVYFFGRIAANRVVFKFNSLSALRYVSWRQAIVGLKYD